MILCLTFFDQKLRFLEHFARGSLSAEKAIFQGGGSMEVSPFFFGKSKIISLAYSPDLHDPPSFSRNVVEGGSCSSNSSDQFFHLRVNGHFEQKNVIFGGFWGPPVPFLGCKKGPNWPPQMWSIMFNRVQPIPNPFGVAGTAYGQIWQFLAKKAINWP